MKCLALAIAAFCACIAVASAGVDRSSTKDMGEPVATEPCEWYGDREWNATLWGTYAFAGTDQGHIGADGFLLHEPRGDLYLETDHAWGGGGDIKYFWHKYFGFGIEGFGLDAKRTRFDFSAASGGPVTFSKTDEDRIIGAALGTFTLRYPIGCSRFAPYVFGGFGGIFGGGEKDHAFAVTPAPIPPFATEHIDGDSKMMGQGGGGN